MCVCVKVCIISHDTVRGGNLSSAGTTKTWREKIKEESKTLN